MVEKIYENIYRIVVVLPNNPLKQLNSYVIKGKGRNLIIDTGFNCSESFEALTDGLKELNIDMKDTDVFLTHFHADHVGLVNHLTENSKDSVIYMHPFEKEITDSYMKNDNLWNTQLSRFLREGFPEEELKLVYKNHPGKKHQPPGFFDTVPVEEGSVVKVGDIELKCIVTPGHTIGHTCLYYEKEKILFSGDNVLFDITPNIAFFPDRKDALSCYFDSLRKVEKLDVKLCFPGHRAVSDNLKGRVNELLEHHEERLQEALDILKENPGISGYGVAKRLKWSIRAKDWNDFPAGQKWFAVSECVAHLDYLVNAGAAECREQPMEGRQVTSYYPVKEKINII